MAKKASRENLIKVGLRLVHSEGYTATGINQVLEAAELPKGSFYHHFSTKDEFVLEVVKLYATGEMERVQRFLNNSNLSPLKKLRQYFKDLIATYGMQGGTIFGCLLGNLSLEVAGSNEEVRTLLKQMFDGWQSAIEETLKEAIAKGELSKSANAEDLAAFLVNCWEGAQVRAKTEQSDRPLQLFFDNAFNVLLKS